VNLNRLFEIAVHHCRTITEKVIVQPTGPGKSFRYKLLDSPSAKDGG